MFQNNYQHMIKRALLVALFNTMWAKTVLRALGKQEKRVIPKTIAITRTKEEVLKVFIVMAKSLKGQSLKKNSMFRLIGVALSPKTNPFVTRSQVWLAADKLLDPH